MVCIPSMCLAVYHRYLITGVQTCVGKWCACRACVGMRWQGTWGHMAVRRLYTVVSQCNSGVHCYPTALRTTQLSLRPLRSDAEASQNILEISQLWDPTKYIKFSTDTLRW